MLIDQLISQGYLKTPRIIDAFRKIKRIDFIPEEFKDQAEGNYPLSIGHGQTISQPLTVAFMLELLQPEPGDKVLDIGSGSGWATALLAEIIFSSLSSWSLASFSEKVRGDRISWLSDLTTGSYRSSRPRGRDSLQDDRMGRVYAIERIPEIKEIGENNIKKYNFVDKKIVQCFCRDGTKGLPEFAPFDKIHVAAAAEEVPQALKDQLAIGGRMVIPVRGGILKLDRISETEFEEEFFPGFVFVPLVSSQRSHS